MAEDFQQFIEQIKRANPIEDVIEACGAEFKLQRKRGKYLRGETHDSLVVRVDEGYYVWNTKSERGDVFNWLEARHKWDFWTSLQWLAERAHLEIPRQFQPTEEAVEKRVAQRTREDIFGVAQAVFSRWLLADTEALAYAHGRGWTDETIHESGIGFSGRSTAAQITDMRGEFAMHEVDPERPEAVAILGYRGDVAAWGRKWGVQVQDNWLEWGLVPGMMGRKRVVYPHIAGGRVRYLSGRNILGDEVNKEGRTVKSWNPPVALAGPRQPFYNHVYGRRAESCVVIEGQADAVTLAQWEIPALALAGTNWQDHDQLLGELGKWHEVIYIGLDSDEAGQNALVGVDDDWPLVKYFGPMGRVLRWPGERLANGERVKDANDLLQFYVQQGHDQAKQGELVKNVLDAAAPMAVAAAGWAGGKRGAEADKAIRTAMGIIALMDQVMLARYREAITNKLGVGVREFSNMVKAAKGEQEKTKEGTLDIVETLGGWIGGYLVEYLYDVEEDRGKLKAKIAEVDAEKAAWKNKIERIGEFIKQSQVLLENLK